MSDAEILAVIVERDKLRAAIAEHHRQKADDRCIEDDDRLYASAGLPPCDRRVGDKAAMLRNCERFIDRRCEGGGWPTYAELEADRDRLLTAIGVCVPSILRVFQTISESELDRDVAAKVLARVEEAMAKTLPKETRCDESKH